jgi:hypothetical protein
MRLFFILSLATAAIAQTNSTNGTVGGVISSSSVITQANGAVGVVRAGPGVSGGTVTGVPYSAEETTETVQTLANGTHITQPAHKVMFYRDSQGRTRTERTFSPLLGVSVPQGVAAPSFIEISDPVSGVHYTLEPRNHVARKVSFVPAPLPQVSKAPPPPPPSSATAPGGGSGGRWFTTATAGQSAPAPGDQTHRPQFSHESLGTQMIEGVLVEGSRSTVVYPIGAMGNDQPITTVTETWMSPELKIPVLSKTSDPRSGESTTRLVNISRAEPDPSLFQVPSDYEVVDAEPIGPNR